MDERQEGAEVISNVILLHYYIFIRYLFFINILSLMMQHRNILRPGKMK